MSIYAAKRYLRYRPFATPVLPPPPPAHKRSERPDTPPETAREAIIYLPSISPSRDEREFASRFRKALIVLRGGTTRANIKCEVEDHSFKYGTNEEYEATKHGISLQENEKEWPIVDIYYLDYHSTVRDKGCNGIPLLQAIELLGFAIAYFFLSLYVLFKTCVPSNITCCPSSTKKTGLNACQASTVAFAAFLVSLFTLIYIFSLFLSVLLAIFSIVDIVNEGDENVKLKITSAAFSITFPLLTLIKDNTWYAETKKEEIAAAVQLFNGLSVYFSSRCCGERLRNGLHRQLKKLLERCNNSNEYEHVHFVSFSFGTCLAIDALFPIEDPSAEVARDGENVFSRVDHLVTFGCPFDVVSAYTSACWLPGYYKGRFNRQGRALDWTNIFLRGDFLASNFRDDTLVENDDGECPPNIGINSVPDEDSQPNRNRSLEANVSSRCGGLNLHSRYFDVDICSHVVDAIFKYPDTDTGRHWICNWGHSIEEPV